MDDDTFYLRPLFSATGPSAHDASSFAPLHHHSTAAHNHQAPPLHTSSTNTICTLCHRHLQCFQRPIENAWYCAACGQKENVFKMMFDETEGYDVLAETHCFTCQIAFPSYRQLLHHCSGKTHKKVLANWLRRGSMKNVAWCDCPAVSEVKHQLMHVLQTTELRFRRHITKEAIARMPVLQLPPSWEVFEQRLFAQQDARHAARRRDIGMDGIDATIVEVEEASSSGVVPSTDDILDGEAKGTIATEQPYRVVHVSPAMARQDFDTLILQLQTEVLFGFDTETAPSSFYPHVARVNASGPHLIQLATSTHVWLISTTTQKGWKSMCRLAQESQDHVEQQTDQVETAASSLVATPTAVPSSLEVNDSDLHEAVDAVLASHGTDTVIGNAPTPDGCGAARCDAHRSRQHQEEKLPPDTCNVFSTFRRFTKRRDAGWQSIRVGRQATAAAVQHDAPQRRLPQFLVDFLHRKDVVLIGFGLSTDVALLATLMAARDNALSGRCGSQPTTQWAPPCIDLSLLFVTDLHSDKPFPPIECPDAGLAGQQCIVPSTNMSTVGTVQAAARVFHRRFPKLKNVSVSNWATPSRKLSTKQLVYACRDAILPLYIADQLLKMRDRRALVATEPPAEIDKTLWSFRNP